MRRHLPLLLSGLLLAAPASAQEKAPDLADYRTVDTALATKLSKAPPKVRPQPGYLGLHAEPRADGTLVVIEVQPDSPASLAGLKKGDTLVKAGTQGLKQPEALREILENLGPGKELTLTIQRGGKTLELTATLSAVSRPLSLGKERALLGIKIVEEAGAMKVTEISKGSPAASADVKVGDLLLKVEKTDITSPGRLQDLLLERRPGDAITLELKRDGKELATRVTLEADRTGKKGFAWDTRGGGYFKKDTYRLAVVTIAYSDQAFNAKITPKHWEEALFTKGTYNEKSATGERVYGSLNDYYQEISYGKLQVTGKVFEPVVVGKKRAEYASNPNKSALLTEALDKLAARDGKDALNNFDGFFFLYAGSRFSTARGGLYWPHKASVKWGSRNWNYFICPEGGSRMDSISVIAHEFGHMLGLPDLYARPEVPDMEGLHIWCTMANGHGNTGKPLHFSAWCKEQLGWLEPTTIDPGVKQKLILRPVYESNKECLKVLVRADGSEYLLLENRGGKGYDKELPGQGMLIWRVVNGKPFLEESHGIDGPAGPRTFLSTVPYPSKANTSFTPHTTPSSRSPRGGGLPIHLTNIHRLADGRVTFWIGYEFY